MSSGQRAIAGQRRQPHSDGRRACQPGANFRAARVSVPRNSHKNNRCQRNGYIHRSQRRDCGNLSTRRTIRLSGIGDECHFPNHSRAACSDPSNCRHSTECGGSDRVCRSARGDRDRHFRKPDFRCERSLHRAGFRRQWNFRRRFYCVDNNRRARDRLRDIDRERHTGDLRGLGCDRCGHRVGNILIDQCCNSSSRAGVCAAARRRCVRPGDLTSGYGAGAG